MFPHLNPSPRATWWCSHTHAPATSPWRQHTPASVERLRWRHRPRKEPRKVGMWIDHLLAHLPYVRLRLCLCLLLLLLSFLILKSRRRVRKTKRWTSVSNLSIDSHLRNGGVVIFSTPTHHFKKLVSHRLSIPV